MKSSKKKLALKKKTVFNLSNQDMKNVKGGGFLDSYFICAGWTTGCSDGCDNNNSFLLCHTDWNCTQGNCTGDCPDPDVPTDAVLV